MKITFFGALAILFIALKLTNYIDWSWWWVTLPLWFPLGFWAVFALIAVVLSLIIAALDNKKNG